MDTMDNSPQITFDEWLKAGLSAGWCGPAVCYTHDGLPMSHDEEEQFEETEPCIHVIRLYANDIEKARIERDHSPSVWRKPYGI